jgi:hypothetical protein
MSDPLFPACPVPDYSHLLAFEAPPPWTDYQRRLSPSKYQEFAKADQITTDILDYYKLNCDAIIKDYKLKIARQITHDSPIIDDLAKMIANVVPDMFQVKFLIFWDVCGSCNLFVLANHDRSLISGYWRKEFGRVHPFACKCVDHYPRIYTHSPVGGSLIVQLPLIRDNADVMRAAAQYGE